MLSFITLGSALGFQDLISLPIPGLYGSYLICCALLLYRRLAGHIKPHNDLDGQRIRPGHLTWGRWRIPGIWGTANNMFACTYLAIIWFFSFWPAQTPVTPQTMNYSALIFGAVLLFSVVWYKVDAHKSYVGPIIEI